MLCDGGVVECVCLWMRGAIVMESSPCDPDVISSHSLFLSETKRAPRGFVVLFGIALKRVKRAPTHIEQSDDTQCRRNDVRLPTSHKQMLTNDAPYAHQNKLYDRLSQLSRCCCF